MLSDKGIRITIIGAVVNVLLSFLKLVAGFLGNSSALIADGIHSFSDLATDVLVIFARMLSCKPADDEHHFGHQKIETFVEIILGAFLIITAIVICIKSGRAIYLHKKIEIGFYTIIIALISIISKEILYKVTINIGKKIKSNAVIANAWHHRIDSFSSIGVLLGLILSYYFKNLQIIDACISLGIGFLIIKSGFEILFSSIKAIVDTAPPLYIRERIQEIIKQNSDILDYHNLRMRYVGSMIYIDLHIQVNQHFTVKQGHDIASILKEQIINDIEDVFDVLIHIEPEESVISNQ